MNKKDVMKLGLIARVAREKANLTQLELAGKLGYNSAQFVSLMERGVSKVPLKTMGQMIVILNIPEKLVTNLLIKAYASEITGEINQGKFEAQKELVQHS